MGPDPESGTGPAQRPGLTTCAGCRHYHVTYEPRFPYGCKLFGFKSRRAPVIEVVMATHQPCQGYEARPTRTG